MHELENLEKSALEQLHLVNSSAALEDLRIAYLGKAGVITLAMRQLANMDLEQKKAFAKELNQIKENITSIIEEKKASLRAKALEEKLNSQQIDTSLPFRPREIGKIHPISQAILELIEITAAMGFKVVHGPEIEDDYHNFTALNIPLNHPARQMHDTFYLKNNMLLRTHTSGVQVRTMLSQTPPVRIISYGRVYRCDSDATHSPMFHQLEGFIIDKNIHMGHLKGCIIELLRKFFEIEDLPVRFRPSFFPFTEPSAEVDIGCTRNKQTISIGGGDDWLEILGCGMIHPNVLKNLNIDPEVYQGFAFGLGIDRMSMLKYGISDLRTFFDGDLRWLKHYGFSAFDVPSLARGLSR